MPDVPLPLLLSQMVELASKKFVCIVDDTKMVSGLGGSKLAMPVEVTPFCYKYNLTRLEQLPEIKGCKAKLRLKPNSEEPYVTDNANYIIDLYFETPMKDANAAGKVRREGEEAAPRLELRLVCAAVIDEFLPRVYAQAISELVGVVEHGLFLNMCDVCIIAGKDGVEVKEKK